MAFRAFVRLRRRFGDPLATPIRWAVVAAAVAGAAFGSKILFWLEDPALTSQNLHNTGYLMSGKTIVGALLLGIVAVEAMKRYIGVRQSTGDLYAIPLAIGIAVGRMGCFLTGLSDNTYGVATALPWGVDFGDGVRRHPTQLYEIVFLLGVIPLLFWMLGEVSKTRFGESGRIRGGDAFKLFMVGYLTFRLLCDFIKPYQRIFLGLGAIQWACMFGLLYYSRDILRWVGVDPRAQPAVES